MGQHSIQFMITDSAGHSVLSNVQTFCYGYTALAIGIAAIAIIALIALIIGLIKRRKRDKLIKHNTPP